MWSCVTDSETSENVFKKDAAADVDCFMWSEICLWRGLVLTYMHWHLVYFVKYLVVQNKFHSVFWIELNLRTLCFFVTLRMWDCFSESFVTKLNIKSLGGPRECVCRFRSSLELSVLPWVILPSIHPSQNIQLLVNIEIAKIWAT